mmetsp:Transcript_26795/g.46484  ORF Transcript_26795/g.46484 Transcript_26795/m.46484 type:complete len:131 (-) Transcript_26795:793-1185(-)
MSQKTVATPVKAGTETIATKYPPGWHCVAEEIVGQWDALVEHQSKLAPMTAVGSTMRATLPRSTCATLGLCGVKSKTLADGELESPKSTVLRRLIAKKATTTCHIECKAWKSANPMMQKIQKSIMAGMKP